MGKASWVLRYRFGGREKEKMLRRNPDLAPKDARELARKDRAQLGFFSGDQAIVLGVKVRKLLLDGRWVRHAQRHNRLGAAASGYGRTSQPHLAKIFCPAAELKNSTKAVACAPVLPSRISTTPASR